MSFKLLLIPRTQSLHPPLLVSVLTGLQGLKIYGPYRCQVSAPIPRPGQVMELNLCKGQSGRQWPAMSAMRWHSSTHGHSKALSELPPKPWTFTHGHTRDAQGSQTWSLSSDKLRTSALLWLAARGRVLEAGREARDVQTTRVAVPWPYERPRFSPLLLRAPLVTHARQMAQVEAARTLHAKTANQKQRCLWGFRRPVPASQNAAECLPQNTCGRRVPGASHPRRASHSWGHSRCESTAAEDGCGRTGCR